MSATEVDKAAVIDTLNRILETELAGVVRYTHYSFTMFGFGRIPIVKWLREQADESLLHAQEAGEYVTALGGHPSLGIGKLLESHQHDVGDMLRESLAHEQAARGLYEQLLGLVSDRNIMLEEYARRLIAEESLHASEVEKMLRPPGTMTPFAL
ncbi:MAG: ferritin-like domain-containing protein [Rhodospirillales bacterium]